MHDAQLCKVHKGDKVLQMACGHLRIKDKVTIGYQSLQFNLMDLDYSEEEQRLTKLPTIQRRRTATLLSPQLVNVSFPKT